MNDLIINNLTYQAYGPIDLTVPSGECVCISGPSGAGKTLLLRALADLDPHRGKVQLGGQSCASISAPSWRKQVGLLLSQSFWWFDTVGEHFASVDKVMLKALGFDETTLQWQIDRLSSGEKQRLALLRLLSQQPKALLLDEPTSNLDDDNTLHVEAVINAYQQKFNTPVLWVSHNKTQIKRVATQHFIIDQGRLVRAPL